MRSTSPAAGPTLHLVRGGPSAPGEVRAPAAPATGGWGVRLALGAVLALAAALRLRGLSTFPLEQDELYTVAESRLLWDVPLAPGIDARPLYFLLQHALFGVLPETPVGLRVVPFLFGLLGVWAVWRAGRWVAGPAAGLVAAFLVALAPWHLHASGMARYWSLLFLLAAGAWLFVLRAYEGDRARDHLAAFALLLAGVLTHPTFLFPAAGVALGATLVRDDGRFGWRWPTRRGWTLLWGPLAVALGAFALGLRLAGREGAVQNWSGRGWLASVRLVPAMVEWLTPAIALAGALGALALLAQSDARRRRWGAMTACGCLAAVGLLLAASTRTDVYADYAIAMLPLLFASAGAGVALAAERMSAGGRWLALSAAALLGAAVLPGTVSHLSSGTRFDYRPAFAHVRRAAPDVLLLTWPHVVQLHYAPDLRARELTLSPARLDSLLAAEGDLWLAASVRRSGIAMDDGGRLAAWIDRHCRREMATERPRLDFRVYRVELWRCGAGREVSGTGMAHAAGP